MSLFSPKPPKSPYELACEQITMLFKASNDIYAAAVNSAKKGYCSVASDQFREARKVRDDAYEMSIRVIKLRQDEESKVFPEHLTSYRD